MTVAARLRRVPLTMTTALVVLGVTLATGALWDPLAGRSLGRVVEHGLPAFEDGRWWTLFTGSFVAV